MRRPTGWMALAIGAIALTAACGGDDDAQGAGSADTIAEVTTDDSGEATLGDPCELVTAAEVEGVLGVAVDASLEGVGDGLPGSNCLWSADGAPAVSIGFTPDGSTFVEANRAGAGDTGMEVIDVDIADGGFLLGDLEIQVASGGHQVIVSRIGPVEVTPDQLRELAETAAAAVG